MRRYFLFFLFVLLFHYCGAQEQAPAVQPWSGFGIEVMAMGGKVFKHEDKFTLPIPALSTGMDVNLMLHTYGKRDWEQRRKYPTLGLAIAYTDYGLDAVYGRCVGVYPNITVPIVNGRNVEWTVRLGDGIGYVSQRYSRVAPVDTTNVAIGSHINDFAMFTTDVRYHVNSHWDFQVGAHFNHISDASYHKPNLGVNLYGVHVGLRYFPVTSRPKHIVRNLKPLKNRWLFQGRFSMAMVSSEAPGGPLYPVYLASLYASKRWLSKNKAFVGIDYSYHTDVYAFLKNNEIYPGQEAEHSYKSAIFFGNEFLLGRIGVVLQVGVYIKQAYLVQDPYYEKIGGHYYIVQREHGPIKEFFLSAFLKTHKTIAELGEFGFGFGF